ncbi:MAG: hypothetical protein KF761_14580 [Salinibacterium sp.]|nr:hypothetical protein [Salinibacterium sp.]
MALSRKRQKELNRLKGQAENLWEDQKELLDHASRVVRDASRQAAQYAREEVSPRIRETFEDSVRPAVNSGLRNARSAAESGRERVLNDVLPAMTSALGTALAAIEVAKNRQVRDAIGRATRIGTDLGTRVGIVKPKPAPAGAGRYILIGIGVVAFAAVAYAAWQTLRADDDLWIDDESETAIADE